MLTLGKGGQRVEVAETDTALITYYTAEGWDEVSDEAPAAALTTVGEQGPEVLPTDPAADGQGDGEDHPRPSPTPAA